MRPHSGPFLGFLIYECSLRSVSSHRIWGPIRSVSSLIMEAHLCQFFAYYIGPLQVSFFAYYMGAPQFTFFVYYVGAPSDLFLRILYGGPSQISSSHTIWGALLGSFSSLTIWGPTQNSFFACHRGPLRSVSSPTMWPPPPPQVSFFVYCMGPLQISFCAYYTGGGGVQISSIAYYMGPP